MPVNLRSHIVVYRCFWCFFALSILVYFLFRSLWMCFFIPDIYIFIFIYTWFHVSLFLFLFQTIMFICLNIPNASFQFICLPLLKTVYLSNRHQVSPFAFLHISPSIHASVSVCLHANLPIYIFVYLSIYISVSLSISIPLYDFFFLFFMPVCLSLSQYTIRCLSVSLCLHESLPISPSLSMLIYVSV